MMKKTTKKKEKKHLNTKYKSRHDLFGSQDAFSIPNGVNLWLRTKKWKNGDAEKIYAEQIFVFIIYWENYKHKR